MRRWEPIKKVSIFVKDVSGLFARVNSKQGNLNEQLTGPLGQELSLPKSIKIGVARDLRRASE